MLVLAPSSGNPASLPPKCLSLQLPQRPQSWSDSQTQGRRGSSCSLPCSPRSLQGPPPPLGACTHAPPNPSTYSSPWHSMGKKGVGGQPRVQKTGEHLESLVRGAGGCGPFPHPRGPSLRPDSLSACLPSSLLDICLPLDVAAPPGWRCEGSGLPAKE